MGQMEDRWNERQGVERPAPLQGSGVDNSQFTEEQKLEAWRQLHAGHLQRQTKAMESIRTYVAVWFWLTIFGAVMLIIQINAARF